MHSLPVDLNIRGKKGLFHQDFVAMTSAGKVALIVEVDIEDPVRRPMSKEERLRNKQSSMEDARAIFKGECASCHALPTKGQYGPTLYDAACGICHDSSKRDPAVPDLKDKIKKESREYWHKWIVNGKKGSLMPGFGKSQGGPLSGSQISTLLHYLSASSSAKVP
jgi:mono/diheme cytochrome c family protein